MREMVGDMFQEYLSPEVVYVIPVALGTRADGGAVMGRGTAKHALQLQPSIQKILGDLLLGYGRLPYLLPGNFAAVPTRLTWDGPTDIHLAEEQFDMLHSFAGDGRRQFYVTVGQYDFPDMFNWWHDVMDITVWRV